jgi:hypothetical protein
VQFVGASQERLKAAVHLPRIVMVGAWPRAEAGEILTAVRKQIADRAHVIANPREYFALEKRTLPPAGPVIFGAGDTRLAIKELASAARHGIVMVTLPDLLEVLDLVREEEAAGTPFDAFGGIAAVSVWEAGARVDALAFDDAVLAKLKAGASAPLILEDARGEGEP